MSLIKDIRLFESEVPNVDGNPTPHYIGNIYDYDHMQCLDVIERLLFLLRHRGFGFDGFDHLYLNFTPCISHGLVQDVNRYNIREFSWYHYVDVGCEAERFNNWSLTEQNAFVLNAVKNAAIMKAPEDQKQIFIDTFDEVIQAGENLLLPYKRKENGELMVEIFVRINDDLDFLPLIRVTSKDGITKAEQKLRSYDRYEFISQISTITIGKSYVRIAPRKNWYADYYSLKPIRIEW